MRRSSARPRTARRTANLAVAITLGTTGKLATIPIKQPKWSYTHRLSWRILSE